ncbi:DUF2312 domain-containing protein [Paracoccus sp. (in: a-proteobacteria)]|uniref:DUF2312 domain-containing protein n=1 Tax=Paracoccus sp. TaxID=267 RepID=UPI00289D44B4|nr:DUF2312 domain-containing protein [Paracoccus sp. (in: a-proteobacteria)]
MHIQNSFDGMPDRLPPPTGSSGAEIMRSADRKRRRAPPVKETAEDRQQSDNHYSVTADELRQFVERIEHLEAEKRDISEQIKEVYAESKGRGFDAKALRKIVAIRKRDPETVAEEEAVLEIYKSAMGMI